jgi:ATP adenylyltransferase
MFPVTPFHLLLVPKIHEPSYFALQDEYKLALPDLLNDCKDWLTFKDPAITAFNIGINDGVDAGQTIMHCHVHLIPRRKGDVASPRGGVRGVIPEKQSYGIEV